MGVRTAVPLLLLGLLLLVLEGAEAYLLDADLIPDLPPPKDYFASESFNRWARLVVSGIGFSFLHAAGVILAIKRWRNKVLNLYEYYDELEDYLLENFPEDFPANLPDYVLDDLPEGFLEDFSNLPDNLADLSSAELAELDLPAADEFPESQVSEVAEAFPYVFPNGAPQAVGFLRPGIFPKVVYGDREGGEEDSNPLFRRNDHSLSGGYHSSAPAMSQGHQLPYNPQQDTSSGYVHAYHPHHSSTYQKRSLQNPPPPPSSPLPSSPTELLFTAVQKLMVTEDTHELVLKTAQLVQEVVEHLDKDDCLLKFLCHIQEKPQEVRAPEQDMLVRLYRLNATAEAPECGREFTNCPVEAERLTEAFKYSWPTEKTDE